MKEILSNEEFEILKDLRDKTEKDLKAIIDDEDSTKQFSTEEHKLTANSVINRKENHLKVLNKIIQAISNE